jgi:integrase
MEEEEEEDEGKIQYVQRVATSTGVKLYFRKGEFRRPLLSLDGSEALREEVRLILADLAQAERAKTPRAGTVGGMLLEYNRVPDGFLAKARSTQVHYQRLIDELIEDCGDVQLADVTPAWLRDLRSIWAVRGYKATNDRRQVLKNALLPAIEDDRIAGDPFAKVPKLKPPHGQGEPHPTWDDREVHVAIEEALARGYPGLARAVALGRWGGFRRGTICAVPLSARIESLDADIGQHRRLYWITEKRRVLCDKREDSRLSDIMARTPNRALTIAYNAYSRPWQPRQLSQALDRLLARLAVQGKVRAATAQDGTISCPLSLHGLRHARGVELAQAGASDAEIMSQLEHSTEDQAGAYRRQAQRRRLADAGQARIDNIIRLKAEAQPPQSKKGL